MRRRAHTRAPDAGENRPYDVTVASARQILQVTSNARRLHSDIVHVVGPPAKSADINPWWRTINFIMDVEMARDDDVILRAGRKG